MLEFDSVDADGVLSRVPLPHAYAERWAKILKHKLFGMNGHDAYYMGEKRKSGQYYDARIEAHSTYITVRTNDNAFAVYFHVEPLKGGVSFSAGMFGEPIPEDLFQELLMAVRDLSYSAQVAEKLIEKSDWLDLNPMFRGLPGVAGRHLSVDQLEAGGGQGKPANWDW